LAAAVAAAVWAAALVIAGGFDVRIGAFTISSHQPMRPVLLGTAALAVYAWANGISRTAATWARVVLRLNHTIVAASLAVLSLALGVSYATTVANASDAYGYVSQADLWLDGRLSVPQPWAAEAPWPEPQWTFSPLAYRPGAGPDPSAIVPVYSPGLPLLMAAGKAIAGHCGIFLVVPLAGAILVLATWGIGRRLGSSGAGLIAAWLVLSSPVFLYMLALPMSDVPVASCWALAFYFALGSGRAAGAAAGAAAGLAVLIRPNLVWLAVLPAAWLIRRWWRTREAMPRSAAWPLIGYAAGVAAAGAFIAVVFDRLYGSPLRSGYGDLGVFFSPAHLWPNARNYAGWLVETQTPLVLAGVAALAWPGRRVWVWAADRAFLQVAGLFVAALWIFYAPYLVFDAWWFLRFLLSSWPFLMLATAAVLLALARTGPAGTLAAMGLVVVVGLNGFARAQAGGAFALQHADRTYVAAARATRSLTTDRVVVFADLHSGSLRYYGGRMTLRFTLLDPLWLDRAVAWLDARGVSSYALLERHEAAAFAAQFAGQAAAARLADRPLLSVAETGLGLYALSGPPAAETIAVSIDDASLRCAGPVAPPASPWR
jgi:4-amino-4-deoxy-L-arabinose transferase-like glycosyltransferase